MLERQLSSPEASNDRIALVAVIPSMMGMLKERGERGIISDADDFA